MKNKKQLFGVAGGLLMIVGVLMPVISIPIAGSITYFNNGQGDGAIVGIAGLLSVILASVKKFGALWITGIGGLAVTIFSFVAVLVKLDQVRSQMLAKLEGNPFSGLAEGLMASVQLQYGWAVLLIGCLGVVSAAAIRQSETEKLNNFEQSDESKSSEGKI